MSSLYIGLISGTSLDAVDAALLDLSGSAQLVSHHSHPIPRHCENEFSPSSMTPVTPACKTLAVLRRTQADCWLTRRSL